MTEQTNQDWKADRIAEYARLEVRKHAWEKNIGETTFLKNLRTELKNARVKLDEAEKPYNERLDAIAQQQAGIKLELAEKWDIEDKTYKCDIGEVVLRTTRSLVIQDKDKLIGFLQTVKKLNECIRNFDISKIRKFKEVGLIENEIATWSEKRNIAIKIPEGK